MKIFKDPYPYKVEFYELELLALSKSCTSNLTGLPDDDACELIIDEIQQWVNTTIGVKKFLYEFIENPPTDRFSFKTNAHVTLFLLRWT